MDFKNFASKIIDDVSGIKSTETSKNVEENDILEGLDLDFSENEYKDLSEDFDLDIDDEIPEERSQKVEQLFDGYLGEKNFDPNPLEYGPNAMYRKNGVVYRKSVDNLWEAYLKDGSPGPRGAAGGSGVGLNEIKSRFGLEDSGSYINVTKPLKLSNGMLLAPFIQTYVSGVPSVSSLSISASTSQRVQLPVGTSFRLWWNGVGPFAYRTGDENVVALSTDFPAVVGYTQIITTSDTHIAVYGLGGGTLIIEGGDGVL